MTQHFALAMWLALTIPATAARATPPSPTERPRLIVLTGIRSLTAEVAEPDDGQSLIRLMLSADEFDIEGLVPFSNMGHGQRVRPELIRRVRMPTRTCGPTSSCTTPAMRPHLPGHPGMTPKWWVEVACLRSWREVDDAQGYLPVVVRVRLRAPIGFL